MLAMWMSDLMIYVTRASSSVIIYARINCCESAYLYYSQEVLI